MGARKSRAVPVVLTILVLISAKAGLPAEGGAGAGRLSVPAADNAARAAETRNSGARAPTLVAPDNAAATPAGGSRDNAAVTPPGEPVDNTAVTPPGGAQDNAAVTPPGGAQDNAAVTPPGGAGTDNTAETPAGASAAQGPEEEFEATPPARIADPLEPVNRAFFVFNDKAYYWVLKPVARGYNAVVPEPVRVSVRNFFSNLATPIRFVNNLLQGKFRGAGTELLRLGINSTIGMAGLFDPAKTGFHIEKRDEDLGQTLGRYGLGGGFYIVWPLLGPSNARDTVGMAGDFFLDPVNYLGDPWVIVGVKAYKTENEVSLSLGDYESLTEPALDPYVAVRDAYVQNRAKKVRE